jgi:prepilin-type N-terminal cleavage/methylation domain-containing protein
MTSEGMRGGIAMFSNFRLTLVELMVVITIVGILGVVFYDAFVMYKERAESPENMEYMECIKAHRDDCVFDWGNNK